MNKLDIIDEMKVSIKQGNTHASIEIISKYPELINVDPFFGTWLHLAAEYGCLKIVEQLVEHGADINLKDGSEETAITRAASNGHLEVVEYLVNHGAPINVDGTEGNPLLCAIDNDNLDIVRFLVDLGVDLKRKYDLHNQTPQTALRYAIGRGFTAIADYLQSKGAPLGPEPSSRPPECASEAVVEYFLDHFGMVDPLSLTRIIEWDEAAIRIHVIHPTSERDSVILFTTGLSELAMNVPTGSEQFRFAELMIELPASWPVAKDVIRSPEFYWPFEAMFRIARYPHSASDWLGGRYTIFTSDDPPKPLGPNVEFSSVLMIANHSGVGPVMHGGNQINIYTLIPLYVEEKDFEVTAGLPALLERLSQFDVDRMLRVGRPNSVLQ